MSAATASSTEPTSVHVRIINEAVDVWRPVPARQVSEAVYQLADAPRPEDEAWAFQPGDTVVVERRGRSRAQGTVLVAVARASALDPASTVYARKAG